MARDFEVSLKNLIDINAKRKTIQYKNAKEKEMMSEIIQHTMFLLEYNERFSGRENLVEQVNFKKKDLYNKKLWFLFKDYGLLE